MAKELNRTMVVPRVIMDGVQRATQQGGYTDTSRKKSKPLSVWYDMDIFNKFLLESGIRFQVEDASNLQDYVVGTCDGYQVPQCIKHLLDEHKNDQYLFFKCPFPSVSVQGDYILKNKKLFVQTLESLKPNNKLLEIINTARQRVLSYSSSNKYNFLHVRVEEDWWEHCDKWVYPPAGRDNCANDTFALGRHMQLKGMETDVPLYVATYWKLVNETMKDSVLKPILSAGYKVVGHAVALQNLTGILNREELALVDYFLAIDSHKFIGNSVSTFSAVVLLERRAVGLWSSYYNGGIIPLANMVPLYKLPWIFSYNQAAKITSGCDEMEDSCIIAAVRSAKATDSLKPYCYYIGDTNTYIYNWLQNQGVQIIHPKQQWIDQASKISQHEYHEWDQNSHDQTRIIDNYLQLQIPLLEELQQYNYILYTDIDVFFRNGIYLDNFPFPLANPISMRLQESGREIDAFGIALWNIHALRQSHTEFMEFAFTFNSVGYSNNYAFDRTTGNGRRDLVLLTKFYEKQIQQQPLPQQFHLIPSRNYQWHENRPLIIHFDDFHPQILLHFLQSCKNQPSIDYLNEGKFGNCVFLVEWYGYLKDQNIDILKQIYEGCQKVIEGGTT